MSELPHLCRSRRTWMLVMLGLEWASVDPPGLACELENEIWQLLDTGGLLLVHANTDTLCMLAGRGQVRNPLKMGDVLVQTLQGFMALRRSVSNQCVEEIKTSHAFRPESTE